MDTILIVMEIKNIKNQYKSQSGYLDTEITAKERKEKSGFFNFCFLDHLPN